MRRLMLILAAAAIAGCSTATEPVAKVRPSVPPHARDVAPWMLAQDSIR